MEKSFCADIPFLKAIEQEHRLISDGVKSANIYVDGRGGQNMEATIRAFRGEPGVLSIWGTLRVLGASREAIVSRLKELGNNRIVVLDREAKLRSDKDGAVMLDAALKKIQGSAKVRNDRKFAKALGAKGGKGKLESMRSKRMPEEIARPIWQSPELTEKRRLELLNPPGYFAGKWTAASAYRHLAKKP
jgi:hypothetical protein